MTGVGQDYTQDAVYAVNRFSGAIAWKHSLPGAWPRGRGRGASRTQRALCLASTPASPSPLARPRSLTARFVIFVTQPASVSTNARAALS